MKTPLLPRFHLLTVLVVAVTLAGPVVRAASFRDAISPIVEREYPSLETLYTHCHAHPELSFREQQTAARLAQELKSLGLEVSTGIGGHGVVGVLKNGAGPTVLIRTDLDALPVKELTALPYASKTRATNDAGVEVDVMHACGHDIHITSLVGAARVLTQLKSRWSGTLVFIGQPAEERGAGARAMLRDGLFTRFPKPDFCLALHVSSDMAAGSVGVVEGFMLANVDSVDITLRGVGGHGAWPHKTKDPVVLAAQSIMALQTIVSRETDPLESAVVTVGSIHGGTKHNIISDEVKLQLTVRSFTDDVRAHTLDSIRRIVRAQAISVGLPEDRLPLVTVDEKEFTPATYNNPELARRIGGAFKQVFGAQNVLSRKPVMGGEDFSEFGRTADKIPICIFWLGSVEPERVADSIKTGQPLPALHSSLYRPVPEPTIKTGVTAMSAAVLELVATK